jgi:hypothetical protein
MPEGKFDELDRERVIRELERRLGIKLSRARNRRIELTDDTGNTFVVLGGVGEWHGLPKELVDHRKEGTLVIAKRTGERMRVFAGPLGPLVCNAEDLHVHESGDYSFNVAWRHDYAVIQEIPSARLPFLCELVYTREDKHKDHKISELKKTLSGMTPTERGALLNLIAEGSGE